MTGGRPVLGALALLTALLGPSNTPLAATPARTAAMTAPHGAPDPAVGRRAPAQCRPPGAQPGIEADAGSARRLQLAAVHQLATGAGRVVAVIDTGVSGHDRLGERLRGVADLLADGDGRTDCDGHGTAVAGLLAAAAGPDDDLVGMAPAATVLSIRQSTRQRPGLDADGRPRPVGDVDTLAEAIVLAVEHGADVVNISEAACLSPARAARDTTVLRDALRFAARRDVVVVAAAGNIGVGGCAGDGAEVSVPGWYDEDVLTVAATGPDDSAAPFTVPGSWVDVAAPGTGLRSLAVGGGLTSDGVEGTSFAAPWVAGLAVLVRERYPRLSAAQVSDRIVATARRPAGGRDPDLGYGVIDPLAALTAEPAVLRRSDAPAPTPVLAALPGTRPTGSEPAAHPPVELPAVAALVGAAGAVGAVGAAVVILRRTRPRMGPPGSPGRPPARS